MSGRDQFNIRYSLYDVSPTNTRGAGALNAPSASAGLDNVDQTIAVGNTLTLSDPHGPRNARPVRARRPDGAAHGSDRPGGEHLRRRFVRHGSGSPTRRVNTMYQVVNNLSHQAGAHALRVGVDVLYNDDHITYPRSVRGSYAFSSLANFPGRHLQQRGIYSDLWRVRRVANESERRRLCAGRMEGASSLTLNLGVRYDLQFLQTIDTDTNNVSPRVGFRLVPLRLAAHLVRGNAGLFHDRVPLRALANALLSAGNTTDLTNLRQIGVSLSPTQTGAPMFPNILSGVVPSVTLVNFTTMDRNLQNAYSRQASLEIEQQLGDRATTSVGYQYLRGLNLLMSVNQNVPTCLASGTNNGCRPNPNYANNNQYPRSRTPTTTAFHLSFVQRPARWGHYRVSYTLSKSMNNVGEAFFSSPIDPLDLSKDWGRSDDDQRHRLVLNGAIIHRWIRRRRPGSGDHGFQVSGMLQAYSALPFNITSGVTTIQGTSGRRPWTDSSSNVTRGTAATFSA